MVNSQTIFIVGCLDAVLYVRKRSAFMYARDMPRRLSAHAVRVGFMAACRRAPHSVVYRTCTGKEGLCQHLGTVSGDQTLSGGKVQSLQRKKWTSPNGKSGCSLRRKLS